MGLVEEGGQADFIRADGAQFTGQVATTDNTLTASGEAFAPAGKPFPDGSTHGRWSMSGSIVERQSITANLTFTTDNGTTVQGALDLTFDPLYNRPSSSATVAGDYVPPGGGFALLISTNGDLQISELICEVGGQIAPVNPSYNLYHVHMSDKCDNGASSEGDGMATLDNTVSPEQLVVGLVGPNATNATVWQRQ